MFCGSASGLLLPPYVVYKAENMWSTWTEGGPPSTRYNRTKSGWFDELTFSDWFENIFVANVVKIPGKKAIIGDNLSSHFSQRVLKLAQENNIVFVCLPANSTHLLQPLDVAYYAPLKRKWRSILDEWKSSAKRSSQSLSKDSFPRLLKKLCENINPDGHSGNLIAGFRKCGIYPLDSNQVLRRLPDGEQRMSTEDNVSEAVLKMLKSLSGVDQPPHKRRKKIDVEPGKSVSIEDINDLSPQSKNILNTKSTEVNTKPTAVNEQDYSESSSSDSHLSNSAGELDSTFHEFTPGQFYVVKFDGKSLPVYYIGQLESADLNDDIYIMKFMRASRKVMYKFIWPSVCDRGGVDKEQIVKKLDEPLKLRRGGLKFNKNQLKRFKTLQ